MPKAATPAPTTGVFYITGKTRYAKVRTPDEKYENYQCPIYVDAENLTKYKSLGLPGEIRADEGGTYVKLTRKHAENRFGKQVVNGPPDIFLVKGDKVEPLPDVLIGNGSDVTVKIEVYNTPRRGAGTKGHRMLAVGVNTLVEYKKAEVSDESAKMPF